MNTPYPHCMRSHHNRNDPSWNVVQKSVHVHHTLCAVMGSHLLKQLDESRDSALKCSSTCHVAGCGAKILRNVTELVIERNNVLQTSILRVVQRFSTTEHFYELANVSFQEATVLTSHLDVVIAVVVLLFGCKETLHLECHIAASCRSQGSCQKLLLVAGRAHMVHTLPQLAMNRQDGVESTGHIALGREAGEKWWGDLSKIVFVKGLILRTVLVWRRSKSTKAFFAELLHLLGR